MPLPAASRAWKRLWQARTSEGASRCRGSQLKSRKKTKMQRLKYWSLSCLLAFSVGIPTQRVSLETRSILCQLQTLRAWCCWVRLVPSQPQNSHIMRFILVNCSGVCLGLGNHNVWRIQACGATFRPLCSFTVRSLKHFIFTAAQESF